VAISYLFYLILRKTPTLPFDCPASTSSLPIFKTINPFFVFVDSILVEQKEIEREERINYAMETGLETNLGKYGINKTKKVKLNFFFLLTKESTGNQENNNDVAHYLSKCW
jgi:hypothetical protein